MGNEDKKYCQYYILCKHGQTCDKALTEEMKNEARRKKMSVWENSDFPECFIPFFEESK